MAFGISDSRGLTFKRGGLDITDSVLIPTSWIIRHKRMKNLILTKSIPELISSSRKSEQMLVDILSGPDVYFPMYHIYYTKVKQWVEYWEPDYAEFEYVPYVFCEWNDFRGKVELSILDVYNPNWEYDKDGFVEYYYNKRILSYIHGKLPIKLKEMCPKNGYDWKDIEVEG